jgi:hypothetical protein
MRVLPQRFRKKKKKMATGQKEKPELVTHDAQKFTTLKKNYFQETLIPFV